MKQRLWAASVSPGQNMSYTTPLFPQHQDRKDGDRYDLTWSAALTSEPEWMLVTSWNEWFEATHIAPSKKFGTKALNQTAAWADGVPQSAALGPGPEPGSLVALPPPAEVRPGQVARSIISGPERASVRHAIPLPANGRSSTQAGIRSERVSNPANPKKPAEGKLLRPNRRLRPSR